MDAFEFIALYPKFVEEIAEVAALKFAPAVDVMRSMDPHDLVNPDSFFVTKTQAAGYVWFIFLDECEKQNLM